MAGLHIDQAGPRLLRDVDDVQALVDGVGRLLVDNGAPVGRAGEDHQHGQHQTEAAKQLGTQRTIDEPPARRDEDAHGVSFCLRRR